MQPIYTQRGYELLTVASALQKSIRRGDFKLAGYMALELFPRYSNYAWKRLLTVSAEDCAGIITKEIKALYDSFEVINKGKKEHEKKGRIFISKAVLLLCEAVKSRDSDILQNYVYDKKTGLTDEQIEATLDECRKENMQIPAYVYDVHTKQGKLSGKTKTQFFIEEEAALTPKQMSLFNIDFETGKER
jgi:replication-associated recombination protein RarA